MKDFAQSLEYGEAMQVYDWLVQQKYINEGSKEVIEVVEDRDPASGIKTQKRHAVDHDQDLMDRTNMLQTFKIKIGETIIPVKLRLEVIHLLKGGISTRLGFT